MKLWIYLCTMILCVIGAFIAIVNLGLLLGDYDKLTSSKGAFWLGFWLLCEFKLKDAHDEIRSLSNS